MARNNYARLSEVKGDIAGISAQRDPVLDPIYLRAIEAESRMVDDLCHRVFYARTGTFYVDGSGTRDLWLSGRDELLTISQVLVDNNDDGVYEITLVEGTDYRALPRNDSPKYRLELLDRGRQLSAWPRRQDSIRITGKRGYSDLTEATGLTGTVADTTTTTITVSADATLLIYPGDTLIVDTEEMYVSAVAATALTVERGINGTTAAAQAAKAISVRRFPPKLEWAVRTRVATHRWDVNSGMPMGDQAPFNGGPEYARYMEAIEPFMVKVAG